MVRNTILALSLVWLVGCGANEQKPAQGGGMPPSHVDVVSVKKGATAIPLEYPAKIKSIQQVEVRAKVSGTLLKKHYTEGALVKEGDLLFKIDPAKFQAAFNEASAQLGVREATLKQSEREWNRIKRLFDEKAVSEKERDDALAAYEMALANVASAKATLENARIDLGYTSITAPISGVAGMKAKDVGAYVNSSSTDSVVTTITQLDPIHVEFAIPDLERLKQAYSLREGTWKEAAQGALKATVLSKEGVVYSDKGRVDFTDSVIDETTGSVKARAIFSNSDRILLPGQFVRVRIEGLMRENSAIIPQEAVMQGAQGAFVYVVKEDKVAMKPIVIEQATSKGFIVSEGLDENDLVIVSNLKKIRPGAPVQVDRRD
ncbi:ACRIFLAVIN RESISTANCE A PRECURSOR [Wolinella succinogenes]|uniref:ACRIFLAVIN RESISTANCE A n=2 Tax=Wolinella succinogenes TaxID=844 RepID=Q7M9Q0_WOLSU|nr:ACRIFLAVIN RESISTANCE A PRECURSOR [Wolinella succinogenes]VEG82098.1 Acriflavine resistance protein A precursor [Wolinella succinogenes]HCZ18056.1 efflux RND transporter periplasmic adaptor subunit [Helicobacter sp.]